MYCKALIDAGAIKVVHMHIQVSHNDYDI